ncbi:MAG: NupC/NupG family nucleoside CNT transporter [bacterium]|nr:NupC/NupG family nucleoside CNT transporter [bacterium]
MNVLRALLGLAFFCALAWVASTNRKRVNYRVVVGGLAMQILLAVVILKTSPGRDALEWVSGVATTLLGFGIDGAQMVFGPIAGFFVDPGATPEGLPAGEVRMFAGYPAHLSPAEQAQVTIVFGLRALPTIIYFSAVMGILYYLGLMQKLIYVMARFMMWLMRVSGAESLAMAANVFVGQTEAPLVVKPYIAKMTRSELMALMTGGFATIAGSVLGVYIGILGPEFTGHLLAASFMSAPAAFVMAKILVPETETPVTAGVVEFAEDDNERPANVLDAAAGATSEGLKLFLNVLAMLIAFVAIVALINHFLSFIPAGDAPLSLERLFGWVFSPVAWMMGVEWADCLNFGTLLGTKVAVNEFIAFGSLKALSMDGAMSERSLTMAAYALCGFANFASIGIQIGGISPIAPSRRKDLSQLAVRAMFGGAFASWMTATIAGMFL